MAGAADKIIDPATDHAVTLLSTLVGFNSVSSRSNLPLVSWVRDYLARYGVASRLLMDAGGEKASLIATIGPVTPDAGGVVLSGHTDVVPVDGQDWTQDPFTLREVDGFLYGRGTADMKGFLACVLSRVPKMAAARLQVPIHLAFSYDEETGCHGAPALAAAVAGLPVPPRLCIVGEPTGMTPITGHKGIAAFDVVVTGRESHSSLAPYAVNAVEAAAELVTFIRGIARRLAGEGPFNPRFDPPFTTLQTGMMSGGTALNIVPNRATLSFEIRTIPGTDVQSIIDEIRQHAYKVIEPRMKDIDPACGFDIRPAAVVPAFDIPAQDKAVAVVQQLGGANATDKVSFATEAGIFQAAGIPTVVCGPGSIAQAHKPDEFIAREQLIRCGHFLDRLVEAAAAGLPGLA